MYVVRDLPLYSRKRHSEVSILPTDHVAWKQNGGSGRRDVRRDPRERNQWVTVEQYRFILAELETSGAVFETRKGPYIILEPYDGQEGYRRVPGSGLRRVLHVYSLARGTWLFRSHIRRNLMEYSPEDPTGPEIYQLELRQNA